MKIIFWNINGQDRTCELNTLADEVRPDILLLAENDIEPNEILNALNRSGCKYYFNRYVCTFDSIKQIHWTKFRLHSLHTPSPIYPQHQHYKPTENQLD